MHKYNLGFISDADIYEHVRNTVKSYCREINLKEFNSNIVDPIKLTFDSKIYGKDTEQTIADECFRRTATRLDISTKTFSTTLVVVGKFQKKALI